MAGLVEAPNQDIRVIDQIKYEPLKRLCEEIERLPGVRIGCFCEDYKERPFMIFFSCNNFYSLSILGRIFDKRYNVASRDWKIFIETSDAGAGKYPNLSFCLTSQKPYNDPIVYASGKDSVEDELDVIVQDLKYWQKSEFDNHFGKDKYNISI